MNKYLLVFSECAGLCSSGGVALVAKSLPLALKRAGVNCRVVIPMYGKMNGEMRNKRKFLKDIFVKLGWRNIWCEVFEIILDGVTYYLVGSQRYFDRETMYEEFDNAERWAAFSKIVCEILPYIDFQPDWIIANDWQTALIPVFNQYLYADIPFYKDIKTAIVIHNLAFQGIYGYEVFHDLLTDLPLEAKGLMEYNGNINYLKAGMQAAHKIITVSPEYALEIAGKSNNSSGYNFGEGLTDFINNESGKLTGIINGIDSASTNPSTDKDIFVNYSPDTAYQEEKRKNKGELQKLLGLEQRDILLIGMVTRISNQKGLDLVIEVLRDRFLERHGVQFVLLGSAANGDWAGKTMEYELKQLEKGNKGRMAVILDFNPPLGSKIFAASDVYIMPSQFEPCGLSQITACMYGAIPICKKTGGLADTIVDNGNGSGCGFLFTEHTAGSLNHAMERAMEAYKNKTEWNALTARAMSKDFSWEAGSVQAYINLLQ